MWSEPNFRLCVRRKRMFADDPVPAFAEFPPCFWLVKLDVAVATEENFA